MKQTIALQVRGAVEELDRQGDFDGPVVIVLLDADLIFVGVPLLLVRRIGVPDISETVEDELEEVNAAIATDDGLAASAPLPEGYWFSFSGTRMTSSQSTRPFVGRSWTVRRTTISSARISILWKTARYQTPLVGPSA